MQQTALRNSLMEPSDHSSQASVSSTVSSKKHKPGNWAGDGSITFLGNAWSISRWGWRTRGDQPSLTPR